MAVRAAGLVIFRVRPEIEYLLMQASYSNHHWSPPKGDTILIITSSSSSTGKSQMDCVIDLKHYLQRHI